MLHALCHSIEYREMATMSRMSRRTKRSVNKSRRSSRRVRRHRGGGDTALQLLVVQAPKPVPPPPAQTPPKSGTPERRAFNAAQAAQKAAAAAAKAAADKATGNITLDTGFIMPAEYKANGTQKQIFSFRLPAGKKMTKLTAMKSGGTAPIDIPIGTSRATGTKMSAMVDSGGLVNIYNVNSSNLGVLGTDTGQFTLTVTTNP